MVHIAPILLGVASAAGVADAFRAAVRAPTTRSPSSFLYNVVPVARGRKRTTPRRFLFNGSDDDMGVESLDADLASEIEEALALAQDALSVDVGADQPRGGAMEVGDAPMDEEDIDEIANMLLEKPRAVVAAPATTAKEVEDAAKAAGMPAPPTEEPPESVVSLSLLEEEAELAKEAERAEEAKMAKEAKEAEELERKRLAEETRKVREELQKKAGEEIERLKNLIFGIKEEVGVAESAAREAEDATDALKTEIEASIRDKESLMKRIESEFASEKELLVAQMGIASDELKAVVDESTRNITDAKSVATKAEQDLISRIESFKAAIDGVSAEVVKINKDKDKIEQTKQSVLDMIVQEGKDKLAQFKKSLNFDIEYAKRINADLARRADDAEGKIRGVYDEINKMRTERVSLQQQIVDVETNALSEIETLQREMKADDERFATALQKERERMDGVIDKVFQAYAIKVCKKIVDRKAVEADYEEKLRVINAQVAAGKAKEAARVKEYLDKMEEGNKKERIAIYQEKVEAIDAIRKQMNDELSVEYAKIDAIHETMRAKIEAVRDQTSQIKAGFEQEMAKKRQVAMEEENELLGQIEGVKVNMTAQMETQRLMYAEQKDAYLTEVNQKISVSEIELRQKWRDLAGIKQTLTDARVERDAISDDVTEKTAVIDSYEEDRASFRKSLRLTTKVAREKIGTKARAAKEKIGTKTRNLLKRD